MFPHIGPVAGKVGLEIGPGDHLGVCRAFIEAGSERMYAAEKYTAPPGDDRIVVVRETVENLVLPKVDFIVSNDVLEHVDDVRATFQRAAALLRPGGKFVSSVDLRGHNIYNRPDRPLDFLVCPNFLWKLLFSHIETTNRVRAIELKDAAEDAGFEVHTEPLARADPFYVDSIRPRLLPRYRHMPDLDVIQILMVAALPADFR